MEKDGGNIGGEIMSFLGFSLFFMGNGLEKEAGCLKVWMGNYVCWDLWRIKE